MKLTTNICHQHDIVSNFFNFDNFFNFRNPRYLYLVALSIYMSISCEIGLRKYCFLILL